MSHNKRLYSVRTGSSKRVTMSLSESTVAGLKELQDLFQSRWPKEAYPSLSCILNSVLVSRLEGYEDDPQVLVEDLKDFRVRYHRKEKG